MRYLLILLLVSGCSTWRKEDTVRESVALAFIAVDYGQTKTIARNPQQYHETNPILGEHPSVGQVNAYYIATAVLHPTLAALLPTDHCIGPICDWRAAFQWVTIAVEAGYVAHNYSIGIKTDF